MGSSVFVTPLTEGEAHLAGASASRGRHKLIHLGCYTGPLPGGELLAIASFGVPESPEVSALYSCELKSFTVLSASPAPSRELLDATLATFLAVFIPADLFVASSISSEAPAPPERGFSSVAGGFEWVNQELTFYTYRVSATDSAKYYYGVSHVKTAVAGAEVCLADGYFGSGGAKNANNKFVNWKRKHAATLTKEVMGLFPRRALAYAHEKLLVGDSYRSDPLCLNSTSGGKDGGLAFLSTRVMVKQASCETHGEAAHAGELCLRCHAERRFSQRICAVHGEATHSGSTCVRCTASATFTEASCELHGSSLFRGGSCMRCKNATQVTRRSCPIHGETKFIGPRCYRCIEQPLTKKHCELHGETTFRGASCARCSSLSGFSERLCLLHGMASHHGDSCTRCRSQDATTKRVCERHGLSAWQGGKCTRCRTEATFSEGDCPTHGKVKLRKGKCLPCAVRSKLVLALCPIHGEAKHQGTRCANCVAEQSRHTRWHKTKMVADCRHCVAQ